MLYANLAASISHWGGPHIRGSCNGSENIFSFNYYMMGSECKLLVARVDVYNFVALSGTYFRSQRLVTSHQTRSTENTFMVLDIELKKYGQIAKATFLYNKAPLLLQSRLTLIHNTIYDVYPVRDRIPGQKGYQNYSQKYTCAQRDTLSPNTNA